MVGYHLHRLVAHSFLFHPMRGNGRASHPCGRKEGHHVRASFPRRCDALAPDDSSPCETIRLARHLCHHEQAELSIHKHSYRAKWFRYAAIRLLLWPAASTTICHPALHPTRGKY